MSDRWLTPLAVAAVLIGLIAAVYEITSNRSAPMDTPGETDSVFDAVAVVNGQPVSAGRFREMLERVGDERLARARVVEEELLIQRGLELGLARQHNAVRGTILQAVTQVVIAENLGLEPDEATLRAYFDQAPERFAAPDALRVERILFDGHAHGEDEAALRAQSAHAALVAGEPFAAVRQRLGDEDLLPMPDEPLPPRALNRHLGPALLRVAMGLNTAQVSPPAGVGRNHYILRLIERVPGEALPFEAARERVASEYRRELNQNALNNYLDWLRGRAQITYADEPADG